MGRISLQQNHQICQMLVPLEKMFVGELVAICPGAQPRSVALVFDQSWLYTISLLKARYIENIQSPLYAL